MPLIRDPPTSSPRQFTSLAGTTAQQTTLATQTIVPSVTSYTPLSTPTDKTPSQTNSSGLSTQAKIGLESGIALGVLVVVVAIGLCVYGFSCRKSHDDSDTIRSYSPEPGTPHASMLDLPSQEMCHNKGLRYAAISNDHPYSNAQFPPTVKAPVAFGQWGSPDLSSHSLMGTAELDEGNTWDRYPRVAELQSGPYKKLSSTARRAELESNNTMNPAAMYKIPRKQVPGLAYEERLPRPKVQIWPT